MVSSSTKIVTRWGSKSPAGDLFVTTMNTARNERARLRLTKRPVKPFSKQPMVEPRRKLNPDQQAMWVVCVEAFDCNMTAMGRELGVTQPAIRKYIIDGKTSPTWPLMERIAALVGRDVDQLRAIGRGGIYLVSDSRWLDPDDLSDEDRLQIIRQLTVPGEVDPETEI